MSSRTYDKNIPSIALEGSLSNYLAQIKKFPMLSAEEEYMLAKSWKDRGDLKAAQSVDALFFPINPGEEELSWQCFLDEGIDKFFSGDFAGDYQRELIQKYEVFLPEHPPWRT